MTNRQRPTARELRTVWFAALFGFITLALDAGADTLSDIAEREWWAIPNAIAWACATGVVAYLLNRRRKFLERHGR